MYSINLSVAFLAAASALDLSFFHPTCLNSAGIIGEIKSALDDYSRTDSFFTDIHLQLDPSCVFIHTEYFTTPSCPSSHCGESFPITFSSGIFKNAALCIPTIHHSHFTFYKLTFPAEKTFLITVDLYNYLTDTYENSTEIAVHTSIDSDVSVYCNSADMCLIMTEYCEDMTFKQHDPPVTLAYDSSSVGDSFIFTMPDIACTMPKFIPKDLLFYSLPYSYEFTPPLELMFLRNRILFNDNYHPSTLQYSYPCLNISLCPSRVLRKINLVEHKIFAIHTSFGLSLVRSFFHTIFSFISRGFGLLMDILLTFVSLHGVVTILDSVFVFFIMKFLMCTSNAFMTSLVFFSVKTLI